MRTRGADPLPWGTKFAALATETSIFKRYCLDISVNEVLSRN
jgi:hypothetical protein